MPVDKFGRMSDAKSRDTEVSLISIIIIFVATEAHPFPVL